jgi:hypothetical protein
MELHRLDGVASDGVATNGVVLDGATSLTASGLDNVDIQDIEPLEVTNTDDEPDFTAGIDEVQIEALEALGYVTEPDIVYEIQDEDGNVVLYADAEENLYVVDGLGELGFFKKIGKGLKNASRFVSRKVVKPAAKGVSRAAKYTGRKIITPAVKTFNRYANPATILLRNGFLLAMKVNMFKVAERLRFGYLSSTEARRRGVSSSGFAKLKKVVERAEKIYEGAGGKKSNLKKAILTGKGNRDKAVPLSGLELGAPYDVDPADLYVDETERFIVEADRDTVAAMLEAEMNIEGLGEVATGTALAAASGIVGSVAALLSKITGVFDKAKNTKQNVTSLVRPTSLAPSVRSPRTLPSRSSTSLIRSSLIRRAPGTPVTRSVRPIVRTAPKPTVTAVRTTSPATRSSVTPPSLTVSTEAVEEKSMLQKYQTPLLIGTGVLVAGGGIYYAMKQKKSSKSLSGTNEMSGLPRDGLGRFATTQPTRKKKRKKTKSKPRKRMPEKLHPVALL